jgi:RNA polymerase sigma-70 factor (ECF subfamily)
MGAEAARTVVALDATGEVPERAAMREASRVAELVVAARRGDRAAFARLYDRFVRVVHAVVLARVPPRDASDVVQDTFLVALERLPDLVDAVAFPGWILAIARSRAADHGRRPRAVELTDEPATSAGVPRRAKLGGVEQPPTAEAERVLVAIQALPEAYRETLVMRLVEGMTGPEIAVLTGLSPGSVRVNLHRGMSLLRQRLGIAEGAP